MTHEKVKELFNLDPETGILYWRVKPCRRICVGDIAGYLSDDGYWRVGFGRKLYLRSRLVFLLCTGFFPVEVDHRNRIPVDDRPGNLRASTRSQNNSNRECGTKNKKSGLPKGVWKRNDHTRKKLFVAEISVNGTKKKIGSFLTPDLASQAYQLAASELHGEFACVGKGSLNCASV
jgi:hypothetical protein